MNSKIVNFILEDIDFASQNSLQNTLQLLSEGATIPFIARYRKEKTNNLDEEQLRTIESKYKYYIDLEKRKETIIETITSQEKLTPALEKQINQCKDKNILEDLYLPYKPKRRTRAAIAREKGLEPLANIIIEQKLTSGSKEQVIEPYVNSEKGVNTIKEALGGALDIIAEHISDNAAIRGWIRNYVYNNGNLTAKVKKEFEKEKTKYEMYYDFQEPVKRIPSHRMLAIRRGIGEKVLSASIEIEHTRILDFIERQILITQKSIFNSDITLAIEDSLKRLIFPSIENEILNLKKTEADEEAISVFSKNLRSLLLAPPAGSLVTMGIDPGFRTGCKVVVIDGTGKFLEYKAIFPHPPQKESDKAAKELLGLINKYKVEIIAIGNGTASRETDLFVTGMIKEHKLNVIRIIVNEAGASVYSASELAKREFPDLDVTVRGAISIARRLQDPLAELVKIDPKSIGVGQYQHDVNQTQLKEALQGIVESCVNYVGVELNTASVELLSYVSGIGPAIAQNIIQYRNENRIFTTRKELLKVTKLGAKAYEQCAGFLRIRESKNPLDNSSVHPESYYVVEKMAKSLNMTTKELVTNETVIRKLKPETYVDDKVGLPTITDILTELQKPGRDPRDVFVTATLNDNIKEISDLKAGMILEGTVSNVTNFGAFVDVGVHQDGLVHISQLSNQYVKDPNEFVSPGQVVKVKIVEVDVPRKRINLTMKDL
jgi:protein Tex